MQSPAKRLTILEHSYINKKYKLYGIEEEVSAESFLPIRLTNVDISVANALRRIFTSEIPNLGFNQDNVKIISNTSQYHREVLIERLGFITVDTLASEKYNQSDLVFSICDANDPSKPLKNDTNSVLKVTVHKHIYIQNSVKRSKIKTETLCPFDSLLLTLNPGESIHTVAQATLGTGRQHAIWQSSIVMYKFETKMDRTDQLESIEDEQNYLGRDKKQPDGVILTIESIGKFSSVAILKRGISVLKKKLENFRYHLLNHDTSDKVSVEIDENIPNLVKLKINNEDHTLGHVLESACLTKLKELIKTTVYAIQNSEVDNPDLEMDLLLESLSAYRKTHPLNNYIELSARTPEKHELSFPQGKFDGVVNHTIRMILFAVEDVITICDELGKDAGDLH